MDKNMILHLPFDDPDGSIAYDFSQYRNDATLSEGANFSKKSKVGKSLALMVRANVKRLVPYPLAVISHFVFGCCLFLKS